MVKKIGSLAVLLSSLAAGAAYAAPCPNIVGTWNVTLQCVGYPDAQNPGQPFFGSRTAQFIVQEQHACAFAGTFFNGDEMVGVLSGPGGNTINWTWLTVVGTGEVAPNKKEITVTYTFSPTAANPGPETACTGGGVRQLRAPT